ncbi:MAG: hypothetical protein QXX94_03475 [Candidatus Bathyarchaeia archaeon]
MQHDFSFEGLKSFLEAAGVNVRRVRWAANEVDAVPPVGHKMRIKTIIDRKVLDFDGVIGRRRRKRSHGDKSH